MTPETRKMTVIFLLYHAPQYVAGLVRAIRDQRHPEYERQEEWLSVLFMDNGSTDETARILREELQRVEMPAHYRMVVNPVNIGYARAVNRAFGLVETPYALTCHCDCLFGSDDYVATMLSLLEHHPDAGTITGQPAIPPGKGIPLAEKVNLVAYLMDVFPVETERQLVSVGFTEGRCDGFRLAAVAAAGFYDTSHHAAGEDQILCARMRAAGFGVYQAPHLRYFLSVSDEQDTIGKLVRHMRLFGEKHPILVLRGGAGKGIVGENAGSNRRARAALRMNQLASALLYVLIVAPLLSVVPFWAWAGAVAAGYAWKAWIFRRHVPAVAFTPAQLLGFLLLQPVFDVAYAYGFARGLWLAARGSWDEGGGSRPA